MRPAAVAFCKAPRARSSRPASVGMADAPAPRASETAPPDDSGAAEPRSSGLFGLAQARTRPTIGFVNKTQCVPCSLERWLPAYAA